MRNLLLNKKKRPMVQAAEPTMGGTSVMTTIPWFENRQLAELATKHLLTQREETQDRTSDVEATSEEIEMEELEWSPDTDVTLVGPNVKNFTRECQVCERETSRRCGYCSRDWFCSDSCQSKMPVHHLGTCSARGVTTADTFYQDCLGDVMPKDQQVRDDFGFSGCRTPISRFYSP